MCLVCSCDKDTEPILYRAAMMGFIQEDGSFLGDDGCIYEFSNIQKDYDWGETKRLMTVFNATAELETGKRYSAYLLGCDFPLYKPAVVGETPEVVDSLGTDPILYSDGWYSGGCLNMINSFYYGHNGVTHLVSLLIKEFPTSSDTLKLRLMHNAGEDKAIAYIDTEDSENMFNFYSSFPISEYLPESGSKVLQIEWLWNDEVHTVCKVVKR